eukprot:543330_1
MTITTRDQYEADNLIWQLGITFNKLMTICKKNGKLVDHINKKVGAKIKEWDTEKTNFKKLTWAEMDDSDLDLDFDITLPSPFGEEREQQQRTKYIFPKNKDETDHQQQQQQQQQPQPQQQEQVEAPQPTKKETKPPTPIHNKVEKNDDEEIVHQPRRIEGELNNNNINVQIDDDAADAANDADSDVTDKDNEGLSQQIHTTIAALIETTIKEQQIIIAQNNKPQQQLVESTYFIKENINKKKECKHQKKKIK